MGIRIKANLDKAKALTQMEKSSNRLDGAAYDSVRKATDLLASQADTVIRDIAGGRYWDIETASDPMPHGGIGRVRTPPNKPHQIFARPERVGGMSTFRTNPEGFQRFSRPMLKFEMGGKEMFAPMVNHPGASPVDWPSGLTGFPEAYERIVEGEVREALSSPDD